MRHFIVLLLALILISGCHKTPGNSKSNDQKKSQTIVIDPIFNSAVFLSLDHQKIVSVPKKLRGTKIDADLWIESGDTEISGLTKDFEGAIHSGEDVKVAIITNTEFHQIKAVPKDIDWAPEIMESKVDVGLCFLVKSSSGKFYKVHIDRIGFIFAFLDLDSRKDSQYTKIMIDKKQSDPIAISLIQNSTIKDNSQKNKIDLKIFYKQQKVAGLRGNQVIRLMASQFHEVKQPSKDTEWREFFGGWGVLRDPLYFLVRKNDKIYKAIFSNSFMALSFVQIKNN